MDKQFWINAWEEGRTGFHQSLFHDKLLAYFPKLHPQQGQKVLVPLCGKSKDMIWLAIQGLDVKGIELYEDAVKAFYKENNLSEELKKRIDITVGDFFQFNESDKYDFIYDRASLVALPPEMRQDYVKVLHRALKKNGQYLLITYQYDENEMQGPPFSISEEEINHLYKENFSLEKMESQRPKQESARFDPVTSLKQNVYILQKR